MQRKVRDTRRPQRPPELPVRTCWRRFVRSESSSGFGEWRCHTKLVHPINGDIRDARQFSMSMIPASAMIISTATVIAAGVIGPPPNPWPWINIHCGVNIGTLHYRGGSLNRWFAGGIDQRIENRVTGTGSLEGDNLVSRQRIASGGVLNLAHYDWIADMGLHHGLDIRQRRSGRRRDDRIRLCDTSSQE